MNLSIYIFTFVLACVTILPKVEGSSPRSCRARNLGSSHWSSVLESGRFQSSLVGDHHLHRLRRELLELYTAVQMYKNQYTEETFGKSFYEMDNELPDLSYDDVIPSSSIIRSTNNDAADTEYAHHLLEAYDLFQRLELSTELVLQQSSSSSPTRMVWSHFRREIQKIVQNLYTEIVGRGIVPPHPLLRESISHNLRCMQHSVYRDIRNFIIYRSVDKVSRFYFKIFTDSD